MKQGVTHGIPPEKKPPCYPLEGKKLDWKDVSPTGEYNSGSIAIQ
jgi:hypothetical protein